MLLEIASSVETPLEGFLLILICPNASMAIYIMIECDGYVMLNCCTKGCHAIVTNCGMTSHPLGQCKKLQKNGCFEDNGDDRGQNSDDPRKQGDSNVQVSNATSKIVF